MYYPSCPICPVCEGLGTCGICEECKRCEPLVIVPMSYQQPDVWACGACYALLQCDLCHGKTHCKYLGPEMNDKSSDVVSHDLDGEGIVICYYCRNGRPSPDGCRDAGYNESEPEVYPSSDSELSEFSRKSDSE